MQWTAIGRFTQGISVQLAIKDTTIYVCSQPVDFRRSIDGLCAIVSDDLPEVPLQSAVFIFYNRYRDKIKILGWHNNGFVLMYKRLSKGKFTFDTREKGYATISSQQCLWLLAGLDWVSLSGWGDELKFENYF